MKTTGPPHSNQNGVKGLATKFTPELSKFIEGMGMYFENQGVPRIGGRILALLMISHDPLSAENIRSILKISRGSISTNMRILTVSGLAEKVTVPGDRTTYFEFPGTALEQMVVARIQSSIIFRKLVDQGLAALTTEDFARHRLENALTWTDLLVETFQKVIDDLHKQSLSLIDKKLENNPSSLTGAPHRVANNITQKN
jgi:DNA-binding transcriptional regulator GbsR (MarR family)